MWGGAGRRWGGGGGGGYRAYNSYIGLVCKHKHTQGRAELVGVWMCVVEGGCGHCESFNREQGHCRVRGGHVDIGRRGRYGIRQLHKTCIQTQSTRRKYR